MPIKKHSKVPSLHQDPVEVRSGDLSPLRTVDFHDDVVNLQLTDRNNEDASNAKPLLIPTLSSGVASPLEQSYQRVEDGVRPTSRDQSARSSRRNSKSAMNKKVKKNSMVGLPKKHAATI